MAMGAPASERLSRNAATSASLEVAAKFIRSAVVRGSGLPWLTSDRPPKTSASTANRLRVGAIIVILWDERTANVSRTTVARGRGSFAPLRLRPRRHEPDPPHRRAAARLDGVPGVAALLVRERSGRRVQRAAHAE